MSTSEIHLELLLSKQVRDLTGKPIGRIQEVCAEKQGEQWVVLEYLVGTAAALERLSAWTIGLKIIQMFGARSSTINDGYRIPWDKLDLTDPEKPRLLCNLEELNKLSD